MIEIEFYIGQLETAEEELAAVYDEVVKCTGILLLERWQATKDKVEECRAEVNVAIEEEKEEKEEEKRWAHLIPGVKVKIKPGYEKQCRAFVKPDLHDGDTTTIIKPFSFGHCGVLTSNRKGYWVSPEYLEVND